MKKIFQSLTILLALGLVFFGGTLLAQPGCTDPQANNFDPQATENDGSCTYSNTDFIPPIITQLPGDLTECSGLAFFNDQLWTHLDGGNPDHLIQIDTLTGNDEQTVTIPTADNLDWEDLAEDDEHIYIGDFGNNFGNRTNLRIFKIKKSDMENGTASPELIEFSYSDQTDFTTAQNANDYDCEAFFYWNGSLHLFSKNWVNFKTRHYILPATPGVHIAQLKDSLNVQGQITAADISDDGKALLLGYNTSTSEVFIWLLFDFNGNDLFSGNKRKISLGSALNTSQVEGIAFRDSTRGYICSESFSILPPRLLSFDIFQYVDNPVFVFDKKATFNLNLFPNPATDLISISFSENIDKNSTISIFEKSGKLISEINLTIGENKINIDVNHLIAGIYWIVFENNGERGVGSFVKK